jgi:hypothetical protein
LYACPVALVEGTIFAAIETPLLPPVWLVPLLHAVAPLRAVVLALAAPFAGGRQAAETQRSSEDGTGDG